MTINPVLLPCPFCGFKPEEDLIDTLYPSGIYWRNAEEGYRHYISHKNYLPGDGQCWLMHCNSCAGGCGAAVTADSKEEAIAKWNRRPLATPMEKVEPPKIHGNQFGVVVDERYTVGRKAITVLSEDDGNWFESMSFDAHWLPELIGVLKAAVQPDCSDGMACMMPDDCWRQGQCLVDKGNT